MNVHLVHPCATNLLHFTARTNALGNQLNSWRIRWSSGRAAYTCCYVIYTIATKKNRHQTPFGKNLGGHCCKRISMTSPLSAPSSPSTWRKFFVRKKRYMITTCFPWMLLTTTDYHWLPLTTTDYHWLSLTTTDYHYDWLRLTATDCDWLRLATDFHWFVCSCQLLCRRNCNCLCCEILPCQILQTHSAQSPLHWTRAEHHFSPSAKNRHISHLSLPLCHMCIYNRL